MCQPDGTARRATPIRRSPFIAQGSVTACDRNHKNDRFQNAPGMQHFKFSMQPARGLLGLSRWISLFGLSGFSKQPITVAVGTASFSTSNCLDTIIPGMLMLPVMLPPGR
jgi:hypothetical protein